MINFFADIPFLSSAVTAFSVIFAAREILTWRGNLTAKYFLTPLITLTVFITVLLSMEWTGTGRYNLLIAASLSFALVADTLLMIVEVNLLKYGIVFFLAGHLLYIGAFATGYAFSGWHIIPAVFFGGAGIFIFKQFRGKTGGLDLPVLLYIVAISVMAFLAVTGGYGGVDVKRFAVPGALLFMASDMVLAVNAFVRPIRNSTVFTWLLYGPAQMLIALSCF